jgi:hypothetical protein
MINDQENLDLDADTFDFALREAVRCGRVIRTKDDEGRDVYTAVPRN